MASAMGPGTASVSAEDICDAASPLHAVMHGLEPLCLVLMPD